MSHNRSPDPVSSRVDSVVEHENRSRIRPESNISVCNGNNANQTFTSPPKRNRKIVNSRRKSNLEGILMQTSQKRDTTRQMQQEDKAHENDEKASKRCKTKYSEDQSEVAKYTAQESASSSTLRSNRTVDAAPINDLRLVHPGHSPARSERDAASSTSSSLLSPCEAFPEPLQSENSNHVQQQHQGNTRSPAHTRRPMSVKDPDHVTQCSDADEPSMLREPLTFRITAEQLVREIKAIYDALVRVEAECIQFDKAQASAIKAYERGELLVLDDRWPELMALHKALMNEHHDFLLASQHVAATPALKELATKYFMAPRLWKHAIHSMLELLRYRLPSSREYMLAFVYHTYQMMCLLYETVPGLQAIWSECAGDLARYRMAIEDEDRETREIWAAMARHWYLKTLENCEGVGRLYHHLGILAKSLPLLQLCLYSRAVISETPFFAARESLICSIDVLRPQFEANFKADNAPEIALIGLHALILDRASSGTFHVALINLSSQLNLSIRNRGTRWQDDGSHMAISAIAAVLEYGNPESSFRRLLDELHGIPSKRTEDDRASGNVPADANVPNDNPDLSADDRTQQYGIALLLGILKIAVGSYMDDQCQKPNQDVLAHLHLILVFMWAMHPIYKIFHQEYPSLQTLFAEFPWTSTCKFMTALQKECKIDDKTAWRQKLPPCNDNGIPLPEDRLLYGVAFARQYVSKIQPNVSEKSYEEKSGEAREVSHERVSRVFWLMYQFAMSEDWIAYDGETTWTAHQQNTSYDCASSAPSSECVAPSEESRASRNTMTSTTTISASTSSEARISPRVIIRKGDEAAQPQKSGSDIVLSWLNQMQLEPAVVSDSVPESETKIRKIVCSKNVILTDDKLFDTVAEDSVIVIPSKVVVKLRRQRRQTKDRKSKDEAHKAFLRISSAVLAQKKVQIWDADGNDVTQEALTAELDPRFENVTRRKDKGAELSGIIGQVRKLALIDRQQAEDNDIDMSSAGSAAEKSLGNLGKRSKWMTVLCMRKATAAFLQGRRPSKDRTASQGSTDSRSTIVEAITRPQDPGADDMDDDSNNDHIRGVMPARDCLQNCIVSLG